MIQSFRNVGWVGIIYLVGLLFALPLRILMEWSNWQEMGHTYEGYQNIFTIMFPVQLVLMFAVPLLLAIFLFRFLQVKSASDFMHSLPVTRATIFNQYVSLGIWYLVIPILFTVITLLLMQGFIELEDFFTIREIFSWAGMTFVITLLVFLAGVFVGTVTGLSAVQGVLTFILLLFPAGITALVLYNLELFLFGFLPNFYLEYNILKLSPVTNVVNFVDYGRTRANDIFSLIEILIYLAIAVIFYGLGMWLYKRRSLETVSQAIVFRQLRPLFKYGVTFCTMLLGGLYFGETENSIGWAIFGYVVGSLIGYFVAEMLLQKTWRVFTHVKGLLIYSVVMVFVGLLINFDITGYQQRVPELDEIERVYFADSSFGYMEEENTTDYYMVDEPMDEHKPFFKKPETINAIQELHHKIIEHQDMLEDPARSDQSVFIAYELKNGGKVVRQYQLSDVKPFEDDLKQIYDSKEFKEAEYEVLHVVPDEIDQITISPSGPVDKRAVIADPKEITDALEALREDIKNDTYSLSDKYDENLSEITILLDDERRLRIHMKFKPSYTEFESVLKDQGKLEESRISAKDIDYAVIVKREDIDDGIRNGPPHRIMESMLKNENALKVTSEEQIQRVWESSTYRNPRDEYLVGLQFKNQKFYEVEVRSFNSEDLPDFVKQHFK